MQPRAAVLVALSATLLTTATALAEECTSALVGSCHILEPSDAISSQGDVAAPILGGDNYIWNEASVTVAPPTPEPGSIATHPGLKLRLGAGGWGEESKEPMAYAQAAFEYLTPPGILWLEPTSATHWYEFACMAGTTLCYEDMRNADTVHYIWLQALSTIQRAYRVVKVNPGTLPKSVLSVPLKIDYRMGVHITGWSEDVDGVGLIPGLAGYAHVLFKDTLQGSSVIKTEGVVCPLKKDRLGCITYGSHEPVPSGANTASGTFDFLAPLASLESLALNINASIRVPNGATCRERQTSQGPTCLNAPWSASGYAVADPFVYIDPAWQYASWFKVEMAADETDTAWVTPVRSAIDTATLMPLGDSGVTPSGGDAGAAQHGDGGSTGQVDAGADGGAVSGGGDGGGDTEATRDGGSPDEVDTGAVSGDGDDDEVPTGDGDGPDSESDGGKKGSAKKGGDGCQLGAGGASSGVGALASLLLGLAMLVRRRAQGRAKAREV